MKGKLQFFLILLLSIIIPGILEATEFYPVKNVPPRNTNKIRVATDSAVLKGSEAKEKIGELFPNTEMFISVMDEKKARDFGFIYLGGNDSIVATVIVQEFSMYRVLEKDLREGVAIRLVITVNEKARKIATMSIPNIAAKSENRRLNATIHLEIKGISGPKISAAIPMPTELNFSTLMQMYKAMDEIKSFMWDPDVELVPQIIAQKK